MEINVCYSTSHSDSLHIRESIKLVNQVQKAFTLIDCPCDTDFPIDDRRSVSFLSVENTLAAIDGYNIFIISSPFDDNWFSHEGNHFSIITTNLWNELYSPPSLRSYITYQFARSAICFCVGLREDITINNRALVHESITGCMNDICMSKCDIKVCLSAGHICHTCRTNLIRYGVSEEHISAVETILSVVRAEALAKPLPVSPRNDVKRVFIIHGHNEEALTKVTKCIEQMGLIPLVLKDMVRPGLDSILNQIAENSNVMCAILLLTGDDKGKLASEKKLRPRARQNVIFEAGYFVGRLGKEKVLMISENGIELPSDLLGCRYIEIDEGGHWKRLLYDDLTWMGLAPNALDSTPPA